MYVYVMIYPCWQVLRQEIVCVFMWYMRVGRCYLKLGDWQESLQGISEASVSQVIVYVFIKWWYIRVGRCYLKLGDWQESLQGISEASVSQVIVYVFIKWWYMRVGRCYLKLGDWQESLQGISEASVSQVIHWYHKAADHDKNWYKVRRLLIFMYWTLFHVHSLRQCIYRVCTLNIS